MFQTLHRLGKGVEALRELDVVSKDPEGTKSHWASWGQPVPRARFLLMANKPKEAVALLQSTNGEGPDEVERLVLLVRANALANELASTQMAITKLRAADPTAASLIEAADALGYLGKKAEALKLLAERPKVFLNATDFSPTGSMRAALPKALDHHFLVTEGDRQIELNSRRRLAQRCRGADGIARDRAARAEEAGRGTRADEATCEEVSVPSAVTEQPHGESRTRRARTSRTRGPAG